MIDGEGCKKAAFAPPPKLTEGDACTVRVNVKVRSRVKVNKGEEGGTTANVMWVCTSTSTCGCRSGAWIECILDGQSAELRGGVVFMVRCMARHGTEPSEEWRNDSVSGDR